MDRFVHSLYDGARKFVGLVPGVQAQTADDRTARANGANVRKPAILIANREQASSLNENQKKTVKTVLKDLTTVVHAQSDTSEKTTLKPWNDLVISGPCSYSKMGKPFDDILFSYVPNTFYTSKHMSREKWDVKFALSENMDKNFGKLAAEGKYKIGAASDLYAKVDMSSKSCSPQCGIVFQPCDYFSNDFGFGVKKVERTVVEAAPNPPLVNLEHLNPKNEHAEAEKAHAQDGGAYSATFYNRSQFKHRAVVVDAGVELPVSPSKVDAKVSTVFGHRYGNVGVLAGLDFATSFPDGFDLSSSFRGVSLGLVFPVNALRLTLETNDMMRVDSYWKINNNLELAARLKTNWRSPNWLGEVNEIGFKYKSSETVSYTSKIDGNCYGTFSALIETDGIKFGLISRMNVSASAYGENLSLGVSVQF